MPRFLLLLALVAFLVSPALAVTFAPGPIDCSLGNGHCYQVVTIEGNAGAPFTWADVNSFARSLWYQGHRGHLLTLETQPEFDSPLVPKIGYLGAVGASNGPYQWTNGYEPGAPVSYFAPFTAAPVAGTGSPCGPDFPRLCLSPAGYYGGPNTARIPGPQPGCPCEQSFAVEYEPDVVPPQVTVLAPNGGGLIYIWPLTVTFFAWSASDD